MNAVALPEQVPEQQRIAQTLFKGSYFPIRVALRVQGFAVLEAHIQRPVDRLIEIELPETPHGHLTVYAADGTVLIETDGLVEKEPLTWKIGVLT